MWLRRCSLTVRGAKAQTSGEGPAYSSLVSHDRQEVLEHLAPFPRLGKGFFLVYTALPINVWRRHLEWIRIVQNILNGGLESSFRDRRLHILIAYVVPRYRLHASRGHGSSVREV